MSSSISPFSLKMFGFRGDTSLRALNVVSDSKSESELIDNLKIKPSLISEILESIWLSANNESLAARLLYLLDPRDITDPVMEAKIKKIERTLRNKKLLNHESLPNVTIRNASTGAILSTTHKSILSLYSSYFKELFSSKKVDDVEIEADIQDLSDEVYQTLITYLYLPSKERESLLLTIDPSLLKELLQLAAQWKIDKLCQKLDDQLPNELNEETYLLINAAIEPIKSKSALENAYERLEQADIVIQDADRRLSTKNKLIRTSCFILSVLLGGFMTYTHFSSARHGAGEVTEGVDNFSETLASILYWTLVVGALSSHMCKDPYYLDKPGTLIFENQLVPGTERIVNLITKKNIGETLSLNRSDILDILQNTTAVTLGAVSLVPTFYKTYVLNPQLSGWFHIFTAGFKAVLDGPKAVLSYHMMLTHFRRRLLSKTENPVEWEDQVRTLKEARDALLAPKSADSLEWFEYLKKIKHKVSIGLLFPSNIVINALYSYLAFSVGCPPPVSATLALISVFSDIYLKVLFPQGKVHEARLQTLDRPRSVKYLRAAAIAVIPLIAWSSEITDVEKSLGKLTDIAWLLTTFKVLNVLYDASYLYGAIPVTTRYYWQEITALSNTKLQEKHQLYKHLDKATRQLEQTKEKESLGSEEP